MRQQKRTPSASHNKWLALGVLFLVLFPSPLTGQIAGLGTYTLLGRPTTARSAALGMNLLALHSTDPTIALDNPSLLTPAMAHTFTLSYISLPASTYAGDIAYIHQTKHLGPIIFNLKYNTTGRIDQYDEEDNNIGTFSASDYVLNIGWGLPIDSNFSIGVNFKPAISQYAEYTAAAIAIDIAGTYVSNSHNFATTLMARNIGSQIKPFSETMEELPFELLWTLSYKLNRAPFRLFFTANELQKWNLRYDDRLHPTTQVDPFTGEETSEPWIEGVVDNLMRHTLFGVEAELGKSLTFSVGYSYRQSAEMIGADIINLSGFSFGATVRTKRFDIIYARHNYHLSQASNYFSITYRL